MVALPLVRPSQCALENRLGTQLLLRRTLPSTRVKQRAALAVHIRVERDLILRGPGSAHRSCP